MLERERPVPEFLSLFVEPQAPADMPTINKGDVLTHVKYGRGVVLNVTDGNMTVRFADDVQKTLQIKMCVVKNLISLEVVKTTSKPTPAFERHFVSFQ